MEGLWFGGFVAGTLVLSGAVTVSVLVLGGGEAKPSWIVTGITVPGRGVGIIPELGFIVCVVATYLTAEAAAATLLARLNRVGFLAVVRPPRLGVAAVTVTFVSCGRIGNKGERLGL